MSGRRWRAISSVRWLSIAVIRCTRVARPGSAGRWPTVRRRSSSSATGPPSSSRSRLEPAGERAEERARVAIAQPHLRRGAAVGDRAQRLGDRLRRRPRQADELAAARRHPLDRRRRCRRCRARARRRAGDAGRRRRRGRRARRRRGARAARGLERRRPPPSRPRAATASLSAASGAATASAITRAWPRSLTSDVVELRVEVGDAGVVRERQAAQHAGDPAGGVVDRRRADAAASHSSSVTPARAVDGDERPVLVHAALGDLGEVGVVEPRRAARRAAASCRCRRAGRRARAASSASPRRRCACRSRARPSSARSCRAGGAGRSGRRRAAATRNG